MDLKPEQVVTLVTNLTANGVPATAIANSLDIPTELVKELISDVRIKQYGSDEISEVVSLLMWEAFEQTLNIIRYGRPADRNKFIQLIMARTMAKSSRDEPENLAKVRDGLLELVTDVRQTQAKDNIYTHVDEDYRVGRRA